MPSRRSFLAALGSAAAAATAGCTVAPADPPDGAWTTPGADPARTAYDPAVTGPADLDGGWTAALPNRDLGAASPVVRDGTVYVTYSEGVRGDDPRSFVAAHDAADGERRWTREVTATAGPSWHPDEPHADSLVAGERGLYLQTAAGLLALDGDGDRRWRAPNFDGDAARFALAHPAVDGDAVYAVGYDADRGVGTVAAYDADTGDRRWRTAIGEGRAPYPPAVADDILVVGDRTEGVVALDPGDGSELWRRDIAVHSPAVVRNGLVYVQRYDDRHSLAALDLDTGADRWWVVVPEATDGSVPTVDGDAVYLATTDGLVARDAATGETLWRFDPEVSSAVPIAEDDSARVAFRRVQPARTADALYVGGAVTTGDEGDRGALYRVDPATGEATDARVLADESRGVRGGLAVADGWVYAASPATGHLFGVRECAVGALGRCLR